MLYAFSITLLKTEGPFHLLTLKDLCVGFVPQFEFIDNFALGGFWLLALLKR